MEEDRVSVRQALSDCHVNLVLILDEARNAYKKAGGLEDENATLLWRSIIEECVLFGIYANLKGGPANDKEKDDRKCEDEK